MSVVERLRRRSAFAAIAAIAAIALASGAVVFWVALHSSGSDWFISETNADVIYTAIRRFGQFPFFSYVFNGGTYFIQDPQSNLFSPAVPLILLAGPSIGLRLMEAVWGIVGVATFTAFMRRRVSLEAALIGAVASVTSLGVLWRIAIGNDMFLWHLGLPGLLWALENAMRGRSVRGAVIFGLVLGLLLLGPTFHSFTYLFLPVVPAFVLLKWALDRPRLRELARSAALLGLGCLVAIVIASPKLECWRVFPMRRLVFDSGVIGVRDALRGLLDYRAAEHTFLPATTLLPKGIPYTGRWGIEECAVALPPIATLLCLAGLSALFGKRSRRRVALPALALVVVGVALSCSWPVWQTFRALTGDNFRAAPRFLAIAGFGMCVLCTLGADAIFLRWPRAALPVSLLVIPLMLASPIWWTRSAARFPDQTVHFEGIDPIARWGAERQVVSELKTYDRLRPFDRDDRDMLSGVACSDCFLVVGNRFKPTFWDAVHTLPLVAKGPANLVRVSHLRVRVDHLEPGVKVMVREREPRFGQTVTTYPPNANVRIRNTLSLLVIENRGETPIDRVVVSPQWPISPLWFLVSATGLLGSACAVLLLGRQGRNRVKPARIEDPSGMNYETIAK